MIWEVSDRCLLSAAGLDRYSKHSQYFCSWGKKKILNQDSWVLSASSSDNVGNIGFGTVSKVFFNTQLFSLHPPSATHSAECYILVCNPAVPARIISSSPTSSALFKWAKWNRAQSRSEESVVSLISVRSIMQNPKPLCTPESVEITPLSLIWTDLIINEETWLINLLSNWAGFIQIRQNLKAIFIWEIYKYFTIRIWIDKAVCQQKAPCQCQQRYSD